jgi:hypothetical protein
MTPKETGGKGPAVDAAGAPVIDPTENVIALVKSGLQRQDDLRELEAKHFRELSRVRSEYEERLRNASENAIDLRSQYEEKLRLAESNRIDAIRAVDVGAVARAAEVSSQQASTLAAQVATSAETLRGQVAAAAIAAATALATALQPITKSIEDLRAAQYAQQGQQAAKTEGRGIDQWFVMAIIAAAAAVAGHFFK